MSNYHLKRITIQHLRGSTAPFVLEFESKKKFTIIYGENGTGKSTICDAFEFLGKGKVGSIEGRGLGKTTDYWASIGKAVGDISVTLEDQNGSCLAYVQKSGVVISPPDRKPKVEILRRSQILSLIEAQPGDRYRVVSRFIDVSGVEASENTLKTLIKNSNADLNTAVARIQENLQAIENFYAVEKMTGKQPLEWAEEETARDFSSITQELKKLGELENAYNALSQQLERVHRATTDLSTAEHQNNEAQRDLDEALAKVSDDASDLLKLLREAQRFFSAHPEPDHCPLCGSSENITGLTQRTTERISQFDSLNKASDRKNVVEKALQQAEQRLETERQELERLSQNFQNICQSQSASTIPLPEQPIPTQPEELTLWFEQAQQVPEQWNELKAQHQDKQKFIATLKKSLSDYYENLGQRQELAALVPRFEQALRAIEEERRNFIDEILSKIADEVGRLYDLIHPGEGLNKISLQLNPKRRASLDIDTEFCGSAGVPPQAYLSESHLDTLGLCIFLALAALDSPEETILVLDDVVASVDEPHVERVIHMLYDEAQRFRHCIITTHYKPWREKFRWGWLQNGQCHFVELTRWNVTKGLSHMRSIPEIQRLRELLSDSQPDLQSVCAKAGVILEATLDFLTLTYECKVPRRQTNRYTLGELLPSLDKKLRQALRVDVLEQDADGNLIYDNDGNLVYETKHLADTIQRIEQIAQARNVFGAHFNTLSFDLLDSDALIFGEAVLELVEVLIDPDNGWPRNDKSGSYWATSKETRRLHPLKKPG